MRINTQPSQSNSGLIPKHSGYLLGTTLLTVFMFAFRLLLGVMTLRSLAMAFAIEPGMSAAAAAPNNLPRADDETMSLSADEIHANVMRTFPADSITTSENLVAYLAEHPEKANALVYLSDVRGFMPTPQVEITADGTTNMSQTLSGRQPPPCQNYHYYVVKAVDTFWDAWVPISTCSNTGKSDGSSQQTIDWSVSKGMEFKFQ